MGTSIVCYLSNEEIGVLQAHVAKMEQLTDAAETPKRAFVFFAAFDGTSNDRENLSLSGNPYQTNVANIADQVEVVSSKQVGVEVRYYAGVGTGGRHGNWVNATLSPDEVVRFVAKRAYLDFAEQAQKYLNENAAATEADISAASIGFSRGTASQIAFAKMLNERGLKLPDGAQVAPPGVAVRGMCLLDPVHAGVAGDMRIPPNVQGPVLVVIAQDEFRKYFKAVDFSGDPRAVIIEAFGNHCGIGGGQDSHGTGAAILEGVTGYYKNMGVRIADVPSELRFDPTQPVALRTEAYQTAANGDVLTDAEGNPILTWQLAGARGARMTVLPGAIARAGDAPTDGACSGIEN